MTSKYLPFLIVFGILFLASLFIGTFGTGYYIRNLYLTYKLNNSEEIKKAVITKVSRRYRTLNITIYFNLVNEAKIYKASVFKLFYGEAYEGKEINVAFNEKGNFYVIKEYKKATIITYISAIVLTIVFFGLSFVFLKPIKEFLKLTHDT